jgi:hypothetical protein
MITPPTPEQVKAINGSKLDDSAIQPFIDSAICILEQVEACIIGKGINDACQTNAAAWLAAHLMANTGGGGQSANVKKSEKFENYSVEFVTGSYDSSGILSTPYGNTANAMSGGCLQEVDKRSAFTFFTGGA